MTIYGDAWRKVHGTVTGRPDNFSWLIQGKLAGSAIPTSKKEVEWMQEVGVKTIVTIREEPLDANWVNEMNYLHVLSDNMGVPSFEDLKNSVDYVHKKIQNEEPVLVHCLAGLGRTGTILACYLIKYEKMSAVDAIHHVREKRHGSIQSFVQEEIIFQYEKTLLD
ncbi:MAG: dual specificity protein phosphatase family protein [Candidatus Nitrosopelagicus sp.]|nr:dual specificity protein phosphatase family protein [Candidatus Nitrosopelagicus sp.]